jgi:hypothetical protein
VTGPGSPRRRRQGDLGVRPAQAVQIAPSFDELRPLIGKASDGAA